MRWKTETKTAEAADGDDIDNNDIADDDDGADNVDDGWW